MMSEQQFETVLAAVADVQASVDAMGLDLQRVVEIVAWTDTDNPQPPAWANGGAEDATDETDGPPEGTAPSVAYPPPTRGSLGAAAGYVVIAACVVLLVVLLVVFSLLGT
jgi:hypothetical protein